MANGGYTLRFDLANGGVVRQLIALFGLLALVLSGLHAGPLAAHGSERSVAAIGVGHDHGHWHASESDDATDSESPADLTSEQNHQHSPSSAAPQSPGSDLERRLDPETIFASEISPLRSGVFAPPLDPPKT